MRNNEPAFPLHIPQGNFVESETVTGMTIRDYFAAKAMGGIFANPKIQEKFNALDMAETCYTVADAMMKAREAKVEE